jgi:PAS domain S-box-containing protein
MESTDEKHSDITSDATETNVSPQDSGAPADRLQQFCSATTAAIVFFDREYRFEHLNRRAWEMIYPLTDIIGRCLYDAFPDTAREDQPYKEHYRLCMEEGIPGDFEAYYPEPLNMWLRVQCYPSGDGIVLFFSDFTEERAAREELKERREAAERQRNEIDTLYRTAPIGLALCDAKDFRTLRLNDRQAEFFGLRADQMMGRRITEIAPMEGLKTLLEQVLKGDAVSDFLIEGELAVQPGKDRSWMVSAFPLYSSDGAVEAISTAWLDMTQQKAAEEALIHSEKLGVRFEERTKLARDLHDTLLQTIQASKMIVDHTLDTVVESTANGRLKQVSDWLDRALNEGRAVLDYLRISGAEGKEFAVALQDAFEDCRAGKSVRLEMSVFGESREMRHGPREGAYRIGCEAIRNACIHSHGNQIAVEISYAPDGFMMSVQDNGVGIDEEMLRSGKLSHYGLTGMRERGVRIGGRLTITGSKGGTKISLFVPADLIYRSDTLQTETHGED